jgi:hypothetical protein
MAEQVTLAFSQKVLVDPIPSTKQGERARINEKSDSGASDSLSAC